MTPTHHKGQTGDQIPGIRIGYALSSEEHSPSELVAQARMAEAHGFEFALISDHFHPWVERQGQSSFVWTVIGGIAATTERLVLGTGVTCPTIRIHPAIIAHASATAAAMMPGRFFLGVGTGENLNEHVHGDRWPPSDLRREMLEEAIGIIRSLWGGAEVTHRGRHYTVENARLHTRPADPPPLHVAASGPLAAELAGRVGDGLIATSPDATVVDGFLQARTDRPAAGQAPPRFGQIAVCWNPDEAAARRMAHEQWPNAAVHGELSAELPSPAHYEQASAEVTEEQVAKVVVCGPDPERHRDAIQRYIDAGFDHIYVHQIGPDQRGFMDFYEQHIFPQFA